MGIDARVNFWDLVIFLCEKLNLKEDDKNCVIYIVQKVVGEGVCDGKKPISICGASIIFVALRSNNAKSFKEVSIACDIKVETIKKVYRMILPMH